MTLPASYTEDDLHLIESWAFENCYRAAIMKTGEDHAVWVAMRERTRSKSHGGYCQRSVGSRKVVEKGVIVESDDLEVPETTVAEAC